jgi:thymidylate synthase (FAD)
VENDWMDDLKYVCEPTKYHEKRYTFKIITDRSVSHELVRHRTFSFAQESQRYCGYDKDKFGGELTFIMPEWYATCKYDSYAMNEFDRCLNDIENLYLWLRDKELSPQEARAILPNCTKTEIIMTGFASDWEHFLDLRYFEKTGKVQPEMKRVATQIFNLLNEYT